jgi:ABC-type nitrate/sulfonate/bicarbonate transport system substrate-binding protein
MMGRFDIGTGGHTMGAPRHLLAAISGLFAAGIAFAHSATALAQAPVTLRYAVDTERNINELSQRLAERQGFFTREGLKLELHRFVATRNREAIAPRSLPRRTSSTWRACSCPN